MKRITIVGGSSPYTVELCEQLRRSRLADWAFELVLHGRTPAALEAVARYARGALVGWKVRTSQALEALQGAHLVIHQPRYGGSAARARGERLASRLGLPADETLGPAGLLAALEITPHIQRFCSILRQACPDAWVINMSNPASLSTSIFALGGQARCIGVCELPMLTRRRIAEFLDVPPPSLEWSYAGFNHRGFLFDLRVDSRPVLDTLLRRLDASGLMGIPTDVIERLGRFRPSISPSSTAIRHCATTAHAYWKTCARRYSPSWSKRRTAILHRWAGARCLGTSSPWCRCSKR